MPGDAARRTALHEAAHVVVARHHRILVTRAWVSRHLHTQPRGVVSVKYLGLNSPNTTRLRHHVDFYMAGRAMDLLTTGKQFRGAYKADDRNGADYAVAWLYGTGQDDPSTDQIVQVLRRSVRRCVALLAQRRATLHTTAARLGDGAALRPWPHRVTRTAGRVTSGAA